MRDLIGLGLMNDKIKQKLIINKGSVQSMSEIPMDLKELYETGVFIANISL